ncbi:MAG: hypothetical protein A3B30_04285 [Candidatus Komeilibacteria bacterium RIFCSPLOWO2_01_FULL_52_15]|uniref:Uncharacterized protein n=2 Tax=Candidatus Komeiliibacteriota TaxID=1817908 RepID=A0A1G2BPS6_9BACT|nr:MAG: hypothetical protein A2677_04045 [Candidatus Komeilibacteria bacterium RIFCSPHIGHO2_01_FULL_52_14]OGY91101.1 MAG: hypothetical protein A3B30_04285 [Candidatus Komeilibacteria bacterium RIFCSPLOWO2_01_FULL_52_15]
MKLIASYAFTLIYWIAFFSLVHLSPFTPVALLLFLICFIALAAMLSGRLFFKDAQLWAHLFLFFISSFLFLTILSSLTAKNLYILFFGLISGALLALVATYTERREQFASHQYLRLVTVSYLITFWQIVAFIYFLIISFSASYANALLLVGLLAYITIHGILSANYLKKSSPFLVTVVTILTTAEFFFFLTLLPLHHYIVATLTTIWLYFIIEMVITGQELSSRRRIFTFYIVLLCAIVALILASSRFIRF